MGLYDGKFTFCKMIKYHERKEAMLQLQPDASDEVTFHHNCAETLKAIKSIVDVAKVASKILK